MAVLFNNGNKTYIYAIKKKLLTYGDNDISGAFHNKVWANIALEVLADDTLERDDIILYIIPNLFMPAVIRILKHKGLTIEYLTSEGACEDRVINFLNKIAKTLNPEIDAQTEVDREAGLPYTPGVGGGVCP